MDGDKKTSSASSPGRRNMNNVAEVLAAVMDERFGKVPHVTCVYVILLTTQEIVSGSRGQ